MKPFRQAPDRRYPIEELIIATRGSKLALTQSAWAGDLMTRLNPGLSYQLLKIKTTGDKILDVPLAQVGGKGLFVKEIEEAMLDGRADAAIHSIKDVPAELPPGLHLAAIPVREDCRDALISASGRDLDDLPKGAVMGTSSLRRAAQLKARRPDLKIVSLRGNVDTRLAKLDRGEMDAIVLAAAGLNRLGLGDRITQLLEPEMMLPAVGQGALGLECRKDDTRTNELLKAVEDPDTRTRVEAERAFLTRLEGGCQVPLACLAELDGETLTVDGLVAGVEGSPYIRRTVSGPARRAAELGRELAEDILGRGGDAILAEVYSS